jgi:hypothetical protein
MKQTKLRKPDLQKIAEMAELQFTDDELQLICELPATDMRDLDVRRAIAAGRLKAEATVRLSIKTSAEQGNSPAQKQFIDLVERRKAAEKGE